MSEHGKALVASGSERVTQGPLAGLMVLDLTTYVAGPYCTRLLADWGAEVLKVEPPGSGDGCRRLGPFPEDLPHQEKSGLFFYLNINKLGITLNLRSRGGQGMFRELVRQADVVVESFRPGVLKGLGLDYESLAQINPDLVMTSITPSGQSGPYSGYRSSKLMADAMGGWLYRIGVRDREPLQTGGWLAYYAGGALAAIGTTAAIHQRGRFGGGQHVDLSLQEAVNNALVYPTVNYSVTGRDLPRRGNAMPGVFACKDGHIGVNALTYQHWEDLFQFMGREDFLQDMSFVMDYYQIEARRPQLEAAFKAWAADRSKMDLFLGGQEWRLPMGVVSTMGDLFANEHLNARGFFQQVPHPFLGSAAVPRPSISLALSPWRARRSAPLLGEHNEHVYSGLLGFSRGELVQLRQQGVV